MIQQVSRAFFRVSLVMIFLAGGVATSSGQDDSGITVEFELYAGGPILMPGAEGEWDGGSIFQPRVTYEDGMLHMFYQGFNAAGDMGAVGYATSEDGINWTKYEGNPVFVPDESIAPYGVNGGVTFLHGEIWTMYFNPGVEREGLADYILRATAPDPAGPWTVDPEPLLEAGDVTDWDFGGYQIDSVVRTEKGLALYFVPQGDNFIVEGKNAIGMATSPDGIAWTKYNDPETNNPRYDVSDPVLKTSDGNGWDSAWVLSPSVLRTEEGWEMFYGGSHYSASEIGYATSEDGVTWIKYGEGALLKREAKHLLGGSVVVVDDTYYLYHVVASGFGTDELETLIGLATGTVTRD